MVRRERSVQMKGDSHDWMSLSKSADPIDDIEDLDESEESDEDDGLISNKRWFQVAVGIVILLNTLLISIESALIQQKQFALQFTIAEVSFSIAYVAEMTIRIKEQGVYGFFCGPNWKSNSYDLLIVSCGVLDGMTILFGHGYRASGGLPLARLGRMLRVTRFYRVNKFLPKNKFVTDISFVIAAAATAMLKLALLVFLLLFTFAVFATDILWDSADLSVRHNFGDLGASMWTLFKMLTLDDWVVVVEEVQRHEPFMRLFFVVFVFMGSIALVSLVPAVFIELQMIDRTNQKKQKTHQAQREERQAQVELLHQVYDMTDTNGRGVVAISELQKVLDELGDTSHGKSRKRTRNPLEREALKDFKLGLFELQLEKFQECGEENSIINKKEFTQGMLQAWKKTDLKFLWRGLATSRMQLQQIFQGFEGSSGNMARQSFGQRDSMAMGSTETVPNCDNNPEPASVLVSGFGGNNRKSGQFQRASLQRSASDDQILGGSNDNEVLDEVRGNISELRETLHHVMGDLSSTLTRTVAEITGEVRLLSSRINVLEATVGRQGTKGATPAEVTDMDTLSASLREERSVIDLLQRLFDEQSRQIGRQSEELKQSCQIGFSRLRDEFTSTADYSRVESESRSLRAEGCGTLAVNQAISLVPVGRGRQRAASMTIIRGAIPSSLPSDRRESRPQSQVLLPSRSLSPSSGHPLLSPAQ